MGRVLSNSSGPLRTLLFSCLWGIEQVAIYCDAYSG